MNPLHLTVTEHATGRPVLEVEGPVDELEQKIFDLCDANPDVRYTITIVTNAVAVELDR